MTEINISYSQKLQLRVETVLFSVLCDVAASGLGVGKERATLATSGLEIETLGLTASFAYRTLSLILLYSSK